MNKSSLPLTATVGLAMALVLGLASADSHRNYKARDLTEGKRLFQANCAACHGDMAQGIVVDWRKRDATGNLPPPPLNGTAHAWHHTVPVLYKTIRDGTQQLGGAMPPMGNTLDREQILLVISWITSLWPDEIYANWLKMH